MFYEGLVKSFNKVGFSGHDIHHEHLMDITQNTPCNILQELFLEKKRNNSDIYKHAQPTLLPSFSA